MEVPGRESSVGRAGSINCLLTVCGAGAGGGWYCPLAVAAVKVVPVVVVLPLSLAWGGPLLVR